jgi:transposase-like protein
MWSDDSDFESPKAPKIRKKLDVLVDKVVKKKSKAEMSGESRVAVSVSENATCAVRNKQGGSRPSSQGAPSGMCRGILKSKNDNDDGQVMVSGGGFRSGGGVICKDVGVQVSASEGSYKRDEGPEKVENINYKVLITKVLYCKDATISWMVSMGLFAKKRLCPVCGEEMRLTVVNKEETSDMVRWRCQRKIPKPHDKRCSLRHGSWFANANMTLEEMLEFTYMWCLGMTQVQIRNEMGVSSNTSVDWASFCREICEEVMLAEVENGVQIGGQDVIVEIDESKFAKRKYHKGHVVKGEWVFGGREKNDKSKCFMLVVKNRDKETLIPLIPKYIAPGSIIRSDCWKSYECLPQYGYVHETVNHSTHFKDPKTGCHTNGIEGDWQKVKRGVSMPRFGVVGQHLQSYLSVHTWRQKHRGKNLYIQFLRDVAKLYDGLCNNVKCAYCNK